ncbi:MAG: type II toxin-antitoxin system VapC family toxin [Candidatus Hodarchaeaceae archaeon]|nr:type II toxin-antitoxin system VapC family toxin [Candidatus Hodarchaeaceae archaeon]
MTAFIDTGVFVAFNNVDDRNHARAIEILQRAMSGEHRSVFTSDYVFDEAVTLALMRTKKPATAIEIGELILGNPPRGIPRFIELLHVDDETFARAWALFKRYSAKGLSFTDCTTIALMKEEGIESLISFDRSFDGIVKRLE